MRKKDSRLEYLPPKTKWILLELSRTWWYKSNEYSLLLIISFPTAKENLSRPATPRHITTRTLCAINMTIKSSKFCWCIVLTNAKILNYKTVNFLVRKKSGQSPYFYFVTSEIQRKKIRSAHNHQNRFTDSSYYISIPLHIEDITRGREDMNFIFEWQNNILRTSAASE